jgi:hypothetical protein
MTQHEKDLEDIRALLGTAEGVRFFTRLMDVCGVYRLSFDVNPYISAFREGQRNVGNIFMDDVTELGIDLRRRG